MTNEEISFEGFNCNKILQDFLWEENPHQDLRFLDLPFRNITSCGRTKKGVFWFETTMDSKYIWIPELGWKEDYLDNLQDRYNSIPFFYQITNNQQLAQSYNAKENITKDYVHQLFDWGRYQLWGEAKEYNKTGGFLHDKITELLQFRRNNHYGWPFSEKDIFDQWTSAYEKRHPNELYAFLFCLNIDNICGPLTAEGTSEFEEDIHIWDVIRSARGRRLENEFPQYTDYLPSPGKLRTNRLLYKRTLRTVDRLDSSMFQIEKNPFHIINMKSFIRNSMSIRKLVCCHTVKLVSRAVFLAVNDILGSIHSMTVPEIEIYQPYQDI